MGSMIPTLDRVNQMELAQIPRFEALVTSLNTVCVCTLINQAKCSLFGSITTHLSQEMRYPRRDLITAQILLEPYQCPLPLHP